MACGRSSSPSSPRAPKIQQESWDDCESPPIHLFDPNSPVSVIRDPSSITRKQRNSSSDSKSARSPDYNTASPTSQRKFIHADNVPITDEAPRSPKYTMFKTPSPNAPSNTNFTDLASSTLYSSGLRSPKYLPTYENQPPISPRRSPNVPDKFVFDAVSPRQDSNASLTGFSVVSPIGTIDTHEFDLVKQNLTTYNKPYCLPTAFINRSGKLKRQLSLHHNNHTMHKNNNPLYPQQQQQHHHNQQQQMQKNLTTDTTITTTTTTPLHNSTNYDLIKQTSEPYSIYYHSNLINDLHDHPQAANVQSSGGTNTPTTTTTADICYDSGQSTTDTNRHSNSARKRQPINITPNPGYQPLNTSHSTLDRTCSDSVVSLSGRKSTSDLTTVTKSSEMPATALHHRRRGSSKSGLALLASRRNSRDSIKSVASNSSIFSNEDLGPLAFQASARGRQRRTSNFLELPVPDHQRPRVCSLPDRPYNPRQSDDLYRLRTFSISKGTVVNCGDSIISRRSRSNTSVNSTTSRASERSPFEGSCCGAGRDVDSLPPSPTDSEPLPPQRYRVVLFGDAGTGKTALVSQFMTSEYMHTYDASLDDEFGEKTVSVLLDGEESEIVFIDHPSSEMSVENSLSTYEPHGCVIVYSVVQRSSFRQAEEMVKYLWRENITKEKAVILVGNKADLARSRVITTAEGKALAKSIEAKFIETSSGIQHNVDELLVGILKQIRLKETRDKKAAAQNAMKMRSSRTHISLHLAKEILQKICLSDITKSKSCENLHVL